MKENKIKEKARNKNRGGKWRSKKYGKRKEKRIKGKEKEIWQQRWKQKEMKDAI